MNPPIRRTILRTYLLARDLFPRSRAHFDTSDTVPFTCNSHLSSQNVSVKRRQDRPALKPRFTATNASKRLFLPLLKGRRTFRRVCSAKWAAMLRSCLRGRDTGFRTPPVPRVVPSHEYLPYIKTLRWWQRTWTTRGGSRPGRRWRRRERAFPRSKSHAMRAQPPTSSRRSRSSRVKLAGCGRDSRSKR